jgi:hypothetical protein
MKGHIVIMMVLIRLFTEPIDRSQLRTCKRFRLHVSKFGQMNQILRRCSTKVFVLISFFFGQRGRDTLLNHQQMSLERGQTQVWKELLQLEARDQCSCS